MKTFYRLILMFALVAFAFACNSNDNEGDDNPRQPMRSVYHWKTTYDPTPAEEAFMRDHGVGRLYLHYFDVVTGDDQAEPAATLRFVKTPDAALEVVPTIYITTEAMSQIASAGDRAITTSSAV